LFLFNDSHTRTSVVSLHESIDGSVWVPILFSTPRTAGNLSGQIVPQSYLAILYVSSMRYFRVSLDAPNPDGVFAHMPEWMPRNTDLEELYAS